MSPSLAITLLFGHFKVDPKPIEPVKSSTNAISRGRWTAVATAPVGIEVTPITRMKYVGWFDASSTRIADHESPALTEPG